MYTLKKMIVFTFFLSSWFSVTEVFAVTQEEQQILSELGTELTYLIDKAMKAKSYQREDDSMRVRYDKLIMDLKEIKLSTELAAGANNSQRKVKNLNLNYVEGL